MTGSLRQSWKGGKEPVPALVHVHAKCCLQRQVTTGQRECMVHPMCCILSPSLAYCLYCCVAGLPASTINEHLGMLLDAAQTAKSPAYLARNVMSLYEK